MSGTKVYFSQVADFGGGNYNGRTGAPTGDWILIYNAESTSINLSNYKLKRSRYTNAALSGETTTEETLPNITINSKSFATVASGDINYMTFRKQLEKVELIYNNAVIDTEPVKVYGANRPSGSNIGDVIGSGGYVITYLGGSDNGSNPLKSFQRQNDGTWLYGTSDHTTIFGKSYFDGLGGGEEVSTVSYLSSIKDVFSNDGAFCALKSNGTIKCWGHADYGGTTPVDISNVKTVYTSNQTFTALTKDNSYITWGKAEHGGGTIKTLKNIKKQPLLNRMYGASTSIHNVKRNNLRIKKNYNFNNSSYNRQVQQLLSLNDKLIIDEFSKKQLDKVNTIKELTNGKINDSELIDINISNHHNRHLILDKIFSNITDVSFNMSVIKADLKNKMTKTNVKVIKSSQIMNAKTDITSDISTNQGVYGNLSELNDHIIVNMDNNISFKVTRTTAKGSIGKYNIQVLAGKMEVYGRHYGTIEFGTSSLVLGEYEDDDNVIINSHAFFFGGFGCNNLTTITNPQNKYQNIVISNAGVAYLDSNGKVTCFGRNIYNTSGLNLDSGVIKLCSTMNNFIALKDDGTVVIWGFNSVIKSKQLSVEHFINGETNRLTYDFSSYLTDIVDIFSFGRDTSFMIVAKKKNNSVIIFGDTVDGQNAYSKTINRDGTLPIHGDILENIHQIYFNPYEYYDSSKMTVIAINNKGKIISWGSEVIYNVSKDEHRTDQLYGNSGGKIINDKYYGISGEILITGNVPNYNGNFYQNYTVDNLPPVSKVFINGSFVTVILNNGTAAWWGITYVYGPRSGTYEKDNTNIVTTSIFDQLRSRNFVDGVTSTSSTALLDSSGGVILFGINQGSYFKSVHPTDIFVDTTNELKNDISANVIKMVATKFETFAFLRNDNTAILVPNVNTDISYNLFPNSYIASITKKGPAISTKKQTYLIPNIKDIYVGGHAALGFITQTNDVILWSYKINNTIIDIGEIVGGKLENVKELFSNGISWCALKYDDTLVCIKGSKESANNKVGYIETMSFIGCDYNDVYFGINGIYSNGGNGKGGCVLNGDGTENVLKNVKNVFPYGKGLKQLDKVNGIVAIGGYIAILDDGVNEKIVYWGNTDLSYKKLHGNITYDTIMSTDGMSLNDVSFAGKTSSNHIFGIHETYTNSGNITTGNSKYKFPNEFNYSECIIIKVTVQNIGGSNKFVLNGDTGSYTFKQGYSYLFDTRDSSNTNYKIAVSNSPDILKNENCVQYLVPGETNSFMRYYKSNKYTYIYCETNGIAMGSLYNPTGTPAEFTALDTAFGGSTERNILSKYIDVPVNKKLLDASLNSITLNTSAKKTAVLESLFTTLPTNSLTIDKDILGFTKASLGGINNPLTYGFNMKVINTTKIIRGISISGETVNSGAVALDNYTLNDSLYVNMNDLSDNILLNIGDKIGAPYSSSPSYVPNFIPGIEFVIRRITASSAAAKYDITSKFGTLVIKTSGVNFNTSNNTGYFVENDKMLIEDVEFNFNNAGFVTKGSKKSFTTITVTVNSDTKFLFNDKTTHPVLEFDKNYKFDVSDSSNTGYKLGFSSSNSTNLYNTIYYGTPGTSGAFVEFTPGNLTSQTVYVFDSLNNQINMGSLYNPMPINIGITKTIIDNLETQVIDNGITIPTGLYSNLVGSTDDAKAIQKNLRRHLMLRTIFANNTKNSLITTTKDNLGFDSSYIKSNYKIFNPLNSTNTININTNTDTDITNTKGFYSPLEDGHVANITLSDGVTILKVERTGTDTNNKGIYYVSTESTDLFVTETTSFTYLINSNPAGPFKDGDTATINYMPLVFGGIGDGRNTNPSLNPSPPDKTPVFSIDVSNIPILSAWSYDWGYSGGFAGVATDGKLYKWGVSNTKYLEPGNGDGNAASSNRITDISFCKMIGYDILYCKTNGLIGNTSAGSGFALNHTNNILYKNGSQINDFSTITDAVDFFTVASGNETSAIVLRRDGSIGFWRGAFSDPYSSQSAINKDRFSLLGNYGKRLMDSTDSNFSKIIKVIGGPSTILLLREDGKIAHLSFTTNDTDRKKVLFWNGPSGVVSPPYLTLENCLEDDGEVKKYFGNVVDIGVFGRFSNGGGYYILNDKGQFMILKTSDSFIGKDKSPHYSISYDTTSPYFKKTIKVLTFRDQYLQITEDYSAIMCGFLWRGGYNKPILNKSNPWEIVSSGSSAYPVTVNILDGKFNSNVDGFIMYNASSKDKRTISKYYGQFILMNDGYVFPAIRFQKEPEGYYPYKYSNWNCNKYGIYGTENGYSSGTTSYGVDLSNVKMVSVGYDAYAALLNDGRVLTWGRGGANGACSNSFSVSSQLTDVKKVLFNGGGAGAALKNNGSVVVWGTTEKGGSITGAAITPGMSNSTLNSGVLDIFCNWDSFTAVKSDGIIVWGKHKNSDYFADLQGKTWAINNNINTKFDSNDAIIGLWWDNSQDPNKVGNIHLYDNSTAITNKVNELLSAGVSQVDINTVLYYPPYMTNLNNVYIPPSFFSTGTKDIIRKLLIELLFLMKPIVNKINHKPLNFSLDTKINKSNLNIFKSNMGVIDLFKYNNIHTGFYCKLEDDDIINFKSIYGDLIFQLKRSGDSYILSKIDGTGDISANDLGPFTSGSLKINNSIIKFLDGSYDGSDEVVQKFNCIATTNRAAAYLTNNGKVITWGSSNYGGYSHEEYYRQDLVGYYRPLYAGSAKANDWNYSISKYQTSVDTDVISEVIDIVSTYRAFAALKANGSVATWGHSSSGGSQIVSSSNVESLLTSDVKKIYSNKEAFCALKKDGMVVCWGNQSYGGNSETNKSGGQLKDVVKVFSHRYGFMALKSDKSVITWGNANSKIDHPTYGVNGSQHNNTTALTALTDVLEIYAGEKDDLYCAIKTDGSLVRWGVNSNVSTGMPTDLYDRLKKINSHSSAPAIVNAYSIGNGIYPVDALGGVYVFSGTSANFTAWTAIKTDISANVTRVVGNDSVIACLRNDNKLIVFRSGSNYKSYGGDFNSSDTSVTNNAHLPPSSYIVNNNTLQNIKDIFPSRTGFAAIDISDNVICWGWKNSNYVNNIDHSKVYGGDLSGNDISKNRPVALFSNGKCWCCLKEDDTAITWEGTNTNSSAANDGAKHIDSTYGINSAYWGGNENGGSIRNDSGSVTTLSNVKNIIPFGEDGGSSSESGSSSGFIALLEDGSGNKSTVAWGSDFTESRWTSGTPSTSGRGFRHIVDNLTSHSRLQIGIFNNRGDYVSWRKTARENLHEFDFGNQAFTGNETGFGSPVTQEETYDVEAIDSDASANGIPSETITKFKNSKLNEDVDETEVFPTETSIFQNSIDATKPIKEVRKQRKNILKLAFANNPRRTKIKTTAASLGYTNLKKKDIMVVKINFGKAILNLKEEKNLDDNTGFLIPIEDGQEATITNKDGTSKFKITRDEISFGDGDGKYFIETVEQVSMITNFESSTYIRGSSPQGPFKDGDRAVISGVPILFGGLTEDDGNYSFGDPYINPIFGGITKLPDKTAMYRLFQGLDVYINCSVDKICEKKQKFMEDWFYKKTGFDSKLFGFITSGYFYNKIYITSENRELFCDFDKQSMTMDEKDQEYFKIANTYGLEKDNKFILNEKCSIYTISWPHKEYNNIEFTVKIYENPQIDNAVSIQVAGNLIDCKGLLVRNYKPSLMRISDIKIKKDKKLNKRLKKAKNKFTTKAIKDENEVWVKIKGT